MYRDMLTLFVLEMRNKFNRLKEIQEEFPELTFFNEGYQYLKKEIQESHKDQIAEISEILKELVDGFTEFNNFKPRKDGTIVVRLQYHWDAMFVGVGYFTFGELEYFVKVSKLAIGSKYSYKEGFLDGTVKTALDYIRANWVAAVVQSEEELSYIHRALNGTNAENGICGIKL